MATLLDWLLHEFPSAKRQTLKRMLENDRVRINGRPARRFDIEISSADAVSVHSLTPLQTPRASLPFPIIHEDADVLVIDKPAGLLTSTTARERRPTAWAHVQRYLADTDPAARAGLIHRLDRDASGLLVFSKSDEAYRSLKTQFFHHTVTRAYAAVVIGKMNPASGRIESYLIERADGSVHSTGENQRRGQRAITDYETISSTKKRSVVRLTLLTGRKHQIRVHLSERGSPIVGDSFYGGGEGPLQLRAIELHFDHPRTGDRATFSQPIPTEMS